MLATIIAIYASISILASVLLLAAVMLSSHHSQQEQPVEAVIVVEEVHSDIALTYSLEV